MTAKRFNWKTLAACAAAIATFSAGALVGANKFGKPHTVIHVITVKWKTDSTPEQRKAAIDGVEKMAAEVPGIKNIWLKTKKVQGEGFENVIGIEFENEAAIKTYEEHAAHKAWYDIYLPIRERSMTQQVTN